MAVITGIIVVTAIFVMFDECSKSEYNYTMKSVSDIRTKPVLCVDLDGTLLKSDVLWESVLLYLKKKPWRIAVLPFWLLKGKAYFKRQISKGVELNPAQLPYHAEVLAFLQEERKRGREIVLATASDKDAVSTIAGYLNIFSKVIASEGTQNLRGREKCKVLQEHFGYKGFDYIGNGAVDLDVWGSANAALLVDPSKRLLAKTEQSVPVQRVFRHKSNRLSTVLKTIRVHHWAKNLLVFVPLVMAHNLADGALLLKAFFAFLAFCSCASSVYILNDLFDLESDRQHPTKKARPFAAGLLPISAGVIAIPFLLTAAFTIALLGLPHLFTAMLILYLITTICYTFYLRSIAILDIIILAGLHTLRVLAGGIAVEVPISAWLLAFSMFLFLSLAFIKRFNELNILKVAVEENASGRGYRKRDLDALQIMGTISGYLSVLVFALYINSREVMTLYSQPNMLWLICPLLLYWITRIWFLSQRGEVHDDPIVATIQDPVSYLIGALVAIVLIVAL